MGNSGGLADLMASQHGVISRRQVRKLDITDGQLRTRLRSGDWSEVAPSVYANTAAPSTWEQRVQTALLGHPVSLVAGRSAAYLHGFPTVRRARPEVMIPYGGNNRSPIARVIRARHFDKVATVTRRGFRCTSPEETVLTLSMTNPAPLIERFVDDQLAAGVLSIGGFGPILDRLEFARQRGLKSLRRIIAARVDDAYQPPTSELERLLYRLLDRHELPPYVRQLPIEYPSITATVDAYIDPWRLIVEGDGRRFHNRQQDHDRDRLRDGEALAAGYAVLRFTWQMLRFEPEASLRRLLAVGAHREQLSVSR